MLTNLLGTFIQIDQIQSLSLHKKNSVMKGF